MISCLYFVDYYLPLASLGATHFLLTKLCYLFLRLFVSLFLDNKYTKILLTKIYILLKGRYHPRKPYTCITYICMWGGGKYMYIYIYIYIQSNMHIWYVGHTHTHTHTYIYIYIYIYIYQWYAYIVCCIHEWRVLNIGDRVHVNLNWIINSS